MKLKQWKTVGEVGGKKRNVEYVYKSVEEVLEEGKFRKVPVQQISWYTPVLRSCCWWSRNYLFKFNKY